VFSARSIALPGYDLSYNQNTMIQLPDLEIPSLAAPSKYMMPEDALVERSEQHLLSKATSFREPELSLRRIYHNILRIIITRGLKGKTLENCTDTV
jgi:hypothetical protein